MCAPLVGLIGAVASIVGTVAGIQAQQAQMQAQADVNRAEADKARAAAQVAERDAIVEKINARTELQKSHFEAQKTRAETRSQVARQTARFAAAGLDPGSGSAALVVNETQQRGQLDNLVQIWGGEATATSHMNEAEDLVIQRDAYIQSAQNYDNAADTLGGGSRGPSSFVSVTAA